LKNELSGGKVQLGNDDMLFYIIDGWYGTIITKSEGYKDGDKATFTDLTRDPVLSTCPVLDVCGDISAKRVFDVQWSGDETSTTQRVSGFAKPYIPGVGRLSVDRKHDFFRLHKTSSGSYVLQHFDKGGSLKNELSGGKVQLGNDDMLFYIIDGWYGTIITKSEGYKDGDEATFTDLTRGPALADCTGRRLANSNDHPLLV